MVNLQLNDWDRINKLYDRDKIYSVIFNNIPIGISFLDADGFIIDCNQFKADMLGYDKEEMLGKHITFFITDKYKEFAKKKFKELKKVGHVSAKLELKKKNGKIIYVKRTVNAIFDDKKNIEKVIVFTDDISDYIDYENSILRLANVVSQATQTIIITDLDGHIEYVNESFEKITGYLLSDVKGNTPNILKSGEHSHSFYKQLWETISKGNVWRGEFVNKKNNGDVFYEKAVIFPIKDINEKVMNYAKIGEDITALKKVEQALKKSEKKYSEISELYRLMADNMPDLIWAKDLDGKFIFVNKAVCEKLLGAKDTNEPIGKDDLFFANRHRSLHPERDDWYTFGELCINSDQVVLENRKPQRFDEYGNVRGKFLYLDVYKAPIFDRYGKIIGTVGHGRVVTKEKEVEKKLIESEKRYRRIFESSQDVIFISSCDGKFLDINPAGLKLLGYSSLEEIKKVNISHDIFIDQNDYIKYRTMLQNEGAIKDYELKLKKKDGSEIIVLETTTAVYDDSYKAITYHGIIRDITEKRLLEKQLIQSQKMESIGTLAGGIAHDFNNLLTVINGYAEFALSHIDKNEPFYKEFKAILSAGEKASNLTKKLLAFSRKQIYSPEVINVNSVIISMGKMLRRLIGEDIFIEEKLSKNLPNIEADESQLEQVFVNLMINARDAIRVAGKSDSEKKIMIETGQVYLNRNNIMRCPDCKIGNYVFFIISDNGSGMNEEIKSKIFEPFFTTKEKGKGTGLGLSTVYGIVRQNGGSVVVDSEVGKGTSVKVYWPIAKGGNMSYKLKDGTSVAGGNETILVVEDEKELRNLTANLLGYKGYKIYTAENGSEALELFKEKSFDIDLIITDLIMPKLNGKELVEKIQKLYSDDIKVIYVSGYANDYLTHDGLLEEGVNFIQKPYTISTLAYMVRKVLDNK